MNTKQTRNASLDAVAVERSAREPRALDVRVHSSARFKCHRDQLEWCVSKFGARGAKVAKELADESRLFDAEDNARTIFKKEF